MRIANSAPAARAFANPDARARTDGQVVASRKTAGIQAGPLEWLDVSLPHTNDHQLPRVLLIGHSITRGYYPDAEKALAGRAYVARLRTCRPGLTSLDSLPIN